MNPIKKLWVKFHLSSWVKRRKFILPESKRPRCFVFLAADYGNLGDVAITYAQEKFLGSQLLGYDIIDVPISQTLTALHSIRRQIRPDDIVTIVGGGNMGDMYYDIEMLRLLVVKTFRRNRIISFPQTTDYNAGEDGGSWLFRLSKRIYNSHPRITLCAREKVSFDRMKKWYPKAKVVLTPDIVMTLDERFPEEPRETVIFCLRDDKEKADNSAIKAQIRTFCNENGWPITHHDTHIGDVRLTREQRTAELQKIWSDFRRSRLVVTDRLHGMIFAFITGTPAVVLPNSNFKVEQCYRWIAPSGYIHFASSAEDTAAFCTAVVTGTLTEQFQPCSKQISQIFQTTLTR